MTPDELRELCKYPERFTSTSDNTERKVVFIRLTSTNVVMWETDDGKPGHCSYNHLNLNLTYTEPIKCPYCGSDIEILELTDGSWYGNCTNSACGYDSPYAETKAQALDLVRRTSVRECEES